MYYWAPYRKCTQLKQKPNESKQFLTYDDKKMDNGLLQYISKCWGWRKQSRDKDQDCKVRLVKMVAVKAVTMAGSVLP